MANSSAAAEDITNRLRVNYWKKDEDVKLLQQVREHGPQNWRSIASHLEGRTGKSELDVVINKFGYVMGRSNSNVLLIFTGSITKLGIKSCYPVMISSGTLFEHEK